MATDDQVTRRLADFVFKIADKLRGPYRPPQYRRVMLPMTVLRRLDAVLEPTKDAVVAEYQRLKKAGEVDAIIHQRLTKIARRGATQPLWNTSPYTFERLLGDPDHLARNLVAYIRGFSPAVQTIFERFGFEAEIEKLDSANRLFLVVKDFAEAELGPDEVTNIQMGYVFEELVRRFNEQANEEAGDHFTPREVIRLMTHLLYTGEEEVYRPGIVRTIYDPACGTGGMLSVSEEYIREHNGKANLQLFGQDYNDESWAICCADLLIKDQPIENIVKGDVLGDGRTKDGHEGRRFHYMLANPPFGVEWKAQKDTVEKEHATRGFDGRFGPGLPRISDGALLFLLHMMSKMHPSPEQGGEGSRIAIVFNGSPLFTGEPGPSESNIRRWIIENDHLDAIIALPDQLFYNTGILTYIWIVTNRKAEHRRGKVQLIDGTRHYVKMRKSLGSKRNRIGDGKEGAPDQISELTQVYADFRDAETCTFTEDGKTVERVVSRIFPNEAFGFLRLTIERPLRVNVQASPERLARLEDETAFKALAESRKTKNAKEAEAERQAGRKEQERIRAVLAKLDSSKLWIDRAEFVKTLETAFKKAGYSLKAPIRKAILSALCERDPSAAIVRDSNGNPEPDPELRDTEIVPLPDGAVLPLPIDYGKDADNRDLVTAFRDHCQAYFDREVRPHWSDAWIDWDKTKLGYEIPLTRHFYCYEPPRELSEIEKNIRDLEGEILAMLRGLAA